MAKVESQISVPTTLDGSSLADWAESAMFIEHRQYMSRSILRHRLRTALSTEGDEIDLAVDLLLSEVARRDQIASQTYPFNETVEGFACKGIPDEALYEFLLWLSVSPRYRQENRYREIDEPFDTLVKQALIRCLGPNAKGVRFAFPSSDGRPSGFPEAVHWLAQLLNLSSGAAIPRPRVKDGGVDIVAWRPFKDRRTGFIVVLCQCTVEENWSPKAKDIVVGKWNGWIDFGLNPLTVLAIPFAVPMAFDRWDELRRTVNIVLDRLRLCELLGPEPVDNIDEIRTWTQAERDLLAAMSSD